MVLVSTKDKIKIYTYLLKEGVFCFKKDYANKNENLDIPNLNCFLVIRSFPNTHKFEEQPKEEENEEREEREEKRERRGRGRGGRRGGRTQESETPSQE